jgi:hypothetical protein
MPVLSPMRATFPTHLILLNLITRKILGPCDHGMVRLQVADGGTASNLEGSCEYIESSRRQLTLGGPAAGGLGEVLTTAYH